MDRIRDYVRLGAASALVWMVCEVVIGLLFLRAGVRLWEYHLLPVADAITSPAAWAVAFGVIPPLFLVYDRIERKRAPDGRPRWGLRLAYLAVFGPIVELAINPLFRLAIGEPLYRYTCLPTFDGSGSWLSPLYYATLLVHFPVERLLRRAPGGESLPSPVPQAASPSTPTTSAGSTSLRRPSASSWRAGPA